MTNHQLEILLKLRDEVSKKLESVQGGLLRFSNSVDKTAQSMKHAGQEISRVGKTMTLFGALITGPLALAFKNAEKYSSVVHDQLEKLGNLTTAFQVQVANALVPIMERFVNILGVLWNAWNNLGPATQQAIVQGAALTGVFLTLGGTLTFLIGKFINLGGRILQAAVSMLRFAVLNPHLAIIIGSITIITVLMIRFKTVADAVLNGVELALLTLINGFEALKITMMRALAFILSGIEKVLTFLAKIPGPQQEMFKNMVQGADEARQKLDELANDGLGNIARNSEKMGKMLSGGQGSLAAGFENIKDKAGEFFDKIKNPPQFNIKPIAERLATLQEISKDVFSAMQRDMSDFFFNSFMQKSFRLQDFFRALGQSILRIWSDLMAKMITRWIETMTSMQSGSGGSSGMNWMGILGRVAGIFGGISSIGGAASVGSATVGGGGGYFGGASTSTFGGIATNFHQGGIIRAHNGLAIDEVPIIAKKGEGVLSDRGMYALGGYHNFNKLNRGEPIAGNMIINNNFYIQTQDAESFLKYKPQIIAVMDEAMKKNTKYRSTNKAYGR